MLELERLFIEVKNIKEKYEQIARITGENFNIFQILGLQSDEVHLHSKFLGELLNRNGSHNQGDKFLSLFLTQLGRKEFNKLDGERLSKFSPSTTKTHIEHHTSKITDDGEQGGRLDILLVDENNIRIIIENKIYAGDQYKQLKRYKNFDKNAILIYLNLFGDIPSLASTAGLKVQDDFTILSYSNDIIAWLKKCLKEATSLPSIRETIHQYIQLLQKMTNQSTFSTMNNEIKKLFCDNPKYFENAPFIYTAYDSLMKEIKNRFFEIMEAKMNQHETGLEVFISESGYKIQLHAEEGVNDGFFFAYRLVNMNNTLRYDAANRAKKKKINDPVIQQSTDNGLFDKYQKILTNVIEHSNSSWYSLCYFNPPEFAGMKKLHQIDVHKFISLHKEEYCRAFIDDLLREESENFEKIREAVIRM